MSSSSLISLENFKRGGFDLLEGRHRSATGRSQRHRALGLVWDGRPWACAKASTVSTIPSNKSPIEDFSLRLRIQAGNGDVA